MAKIRSNRDFELPSPFEASRLLSSHEGSEREPRARMIKLLVSNPEISAIELAVAIRKSESTTRRYLRILSEKGVDGLLEISGTSRLPAGVSGKIRAMILNGMMTSIRQIRDWIDENYGIRYTISGLTRLLKREIPVIRRLEIDNRSRIKYGETAASSYESIEEMFSVQKLLDLINSMPTAIEPRAWASDIKKALASILPGSPLIRITLNTSSELDPQKPQRPGFKVVTRPDSMPKIPKKASVRATVRLELSDAGHEDEEKYLISALGSDIKLELYYPPIVSMHYIAEHVYLGAILVLYKRDGYDHRNKAEMVLDRIAPFLRFCLSDGITRQRFHLPEQRLLQRILERFAFEHKLTNRERQVFMLHVLGATYNDIATQMGRQPNTIKNQISSIHRKTKTSSHGELLRMVFGFEY